MHFLYDSYFYFVGFSAGIYLVLLNHFLHSCQLASKKNMFNLLTLSLLGVLSSKALFIMTSGVANHTLKGGLVFFGFLIPTFAFWLLSDFSKKSLDFFGSAGKSLALAHSIGRLGCWVNGCCYGELFSLPLQALESVFLFLVFIRLQKTKNADIFFIYIITYCPFRFLIEFYRDDIIRGGITGFSTSQMIAIALVCMSILRKFSEQKFQEHKVPI